MLFRSGVGACLRNGSVVCSGTTTACNVAAGAPTAETCNNVDDNCDGAVDNGVTQTCYAGPGGTSGVGPCRSGTTTCSAGSFGACVGQVVPTGEVCDGIDNNCNGSVDEGVRTTFYRDLDGDGWGSTAYGTTLACSAPSGYRATSSDCNDGNGAIYPGRGEVCNGVDDNCNGSIDEGVLTTFYRDLDGDGWGSATYGTTLACSMPSGYRTTNSDCNDANGAIYPGRGEVCNGADDNCNGSVDEGVGTTFYRDLDGDGWGSATYGTVVACSMPGGYRTTNSDCNDANGAIYPGRAEVCNSADDNCNGSVDEGVGATTFYRDNDGDGWGSSTYGTVVACSMPSGYRTTNSDCNDANGAIYPGRAEVCNNLDDNCNGTRDEGGTVTCRTFPSGSGSNGGSGASCRASYSFSVVAGRTYTISTCGSYSGDPWLRVSGACSCSNDDACGLGSSCTCTATSNGTATICASTYSTSAASWRYTVTVASVCTSC